MDKYARGHNAVAKGQDHCHAVPALPVMRNWNPDLAVGGDEPRDLLHCGP